MRSHVGSYITQSLFLEIGYNLKFATYSLEDEHKEYEGKLYPSLKKLYIEMGDLGEYEFANKYLCNWTHWTKIRNNAILGRHIDVWKDELILSLRSRALQSMIDLSEVSGNYSATKWIMDMGWENKGSGRPSKAQQEERARQDELLEKEYLADVQHMADYKKKVQYGTVAR